MSENIFDKFDSAINKADLEKAREEASTGSLEAPAGKYTGTIEKMEIGLTKDKRPMFKVQIRLATGEDADTADYMKHFKNKKPCLFMNRVMFGTKNDANMIASVEGWLNKLGFEEPFAFTTFSQFNDDILDACEELEGEVFDIEYDPEAFNSIIINA